MLGSGSWAWSTPANLLLWLPCAQRGRTWTECMAQIFSWARGSAVTPQEVEACFPCVHTNTRFPVFKADLQALANLGESAARFWGQSCSVAGNASGFWLVLRFPWWFGQCCRCLHPPKQEDLACVCPTKVQQSSAVCSQADLLFWQAADHCFLLTYALQGSTWRSGRCPCSWSRYAAQTRQQVQAARGRRHWPSRLAAPPRTQYGPVRCYRWSWTQMMRRTRMSRKRKGERALANFVTAFGPAACVLGLLALSNGFSCLAFRSQADVVGLGCFLGSILACLLLSAVSQLLTGSEWRWFKCRAKRAKAQGLAPAGGRVAKHKPSRPPTAPVLTAMLQQGGGQLVAGLIPTSAAGSAELRKAMLAAPVRVRAEGAVAAAPTPAAVGSHRSADDPELLARKNRKPQYVHVKQNVWVSKPRPK